ncbi:MAG: hypothetical protein OEW39_10805 [Deltaproteobacteria bacterium]|nr:hypothetical protein [Deltaproteobacteria bacterium]
MRRFSILAGSVLLFLLFFWLGLKWNFPEETVTRFIKSRLEPLKEVEVQLSPARMGWTSLYFDSVQIRSAETPEGPPLVSLSDVRIPFSWRLPLGLMTVGTLDGGGEVRVFIPWRTGGNASVLGHIPFQTITLPPELGPIKLEGLLDLNGKFEMTQSLGLLTELPPGTLTGVGKNLRVSGITYSGIEIPPTRLESASFTLQSGRVLNLEQLIFTGDMQGNMKGVMTPNFRTPMLSSIRLEAQVTPAQEWMQKLGNLRPLLDSFIKQGRLTFTLDGSLARLRFSEGKAE